MGIAGVGIFAKTFKRSSVNEIFQSISEFGMTLVHYNMACSGLPSLPLNISQQTNQEIRDSAVKHNIHVVGLSATFNMIHPDMSVRIRGLQALKELAGFAQNLGIAMISLCTGTRDQQNTWKWHKENTSTRAWIDLLNTMDKAIWIAEDADIYLGVEPEPGNVIRNGSFAKRLLDNMKSDRLKIILDPANLFEKGESRQDNRDKIDQFIDLLHDQIYMVHAKDRTLEGKIVPAGKGIVDFEFLMNRVQKLKGNIPIILHDLQENDVRDSVDYIKRLMPTIVSTKNTN